MKLGGGDVFGGYANAFRPAEATCSSVTGRYRI
jgi:hypothetical protein